MAVHPSFECFFKRREQIILMLLEDGRADPSFRCSRALITAVSQNHPQMVLACRLGQEDIVRILLEDGRSDIVENECLSIARERGHEVVMDLLLQDPVADLFWYFEEE